MLFARQRKVRIQARSQQRGRLKFFEYEITGFPSHLNRARADMLVGFFERLTLAGERILVSLYPLSDEHWDQLSRSEWTTLARTPGMSMGWQSQRGWVMGHAHTHEKLAEVYRHGWSYSLADPVLVVIAPADKDAIFLEAHHADAVPGREDILAEFYPVVIGRHFHGVALRLVSTRLEPEEIVTHLNATCPNYQIELSRD